MNPDGGPLNAPGGPLHPDNLKRPRIPGIPSKFHPYVIPYRGRRAEADGVEGEFLDDPSMPAVLPQKPIKDPPYRGSKVEGEMQQMDPRMMQQMMMMMQQQGGMGGMPPMMDPQKKKI